MIPASKTGYSDKWMTPPDTLKAIQEEFGPLWDPCPITWAPGDPDALEMPWAPVTFCNPPYSRVADFVKKAASEHQAGCTVILLINAATDTRWFHSYIYNKPNVEIRFFKGRLKFINPKEPTKLVPSPRPSMLVIFKAI